MASEQIFLSDIHFGAQAPYGRERLLNDLRRLTAHCAARQIRISVLGDLFDYWMEYPRYYPPYAAPLLEIFSDFHRHTGFRSLLITGNHDNWTRDTLPEAGFDLEPEYRQVKLDNRQAILLHGDGLADPRFGLPRPLFHRVLRHPALIRSYQTLLPPAAGIELMRRFSDYSRTRSDEDPGRLDGWASDYLGKSEIDFVICGHDHTPRLIRFNSGILINSGAFYRDKTLVHYTNGSLRIVTWDSENGIFTPYRNLEASTA